MAVALTTPTYTVGNWVGNATDDNGVDWVVESEDGWSSSPPVRPILEDRAAGDGSWSGPGYYSARVITLSGKAIASSRLQMLAAKETFKSAVARLVRTLTVLKVDEAHLSRIAYVRLSDQIAVTDLGSIGFEWTLILVAPDPRRYAATPTVATTGLPADAAAGRTYPRTYPLTYGGAVAGGSGSAYIEQAGDYDQTPAVITFTGPVITPSVYHIQTSRSLVFDLTLADGETLVVNLGDQTALLNGTASRVSTLTTGSAWMMLVPGPNEFQFRGQDPGAGNTPSMTVTASSAWT